MLDGHHDEWNRWAVDQVNVLHAAGRMFTERDHIHTGLYRFEWEYRRDEDGVPAELTFDHRFPGMVSVFVEPADGVTPEQVGSWYRTQYLPSVLPGSAVATVLAFSPLPLLADAPGDVPRSEADDRRLLLLHFLDEEPVGSWDAVFAGQAGFGGRCRPRPGAMGLTVHRNRARHRHLHRPAVVDPGLMADFIEELDQRTAARGWVGAPTLWGLDRAPGRGHPRRRAGPRGHRQGAHLRRIPRRLPRAPPPPCSPTTG